MNNAGAGAGAGAGAQQRRLMFPPGLRFLPTDEELLTVYLRSETAGGPSLARFTIPTCNLFGAQEGCDPWVAQRELAFPYGKGSEFYCFTPRSERGPGACRTTPSGKWSAKGKNVAIRAKRTGEVVGHRLMLNFVPNDHGAGPECQYWIMHEFRLPDNCAGKKGGAFSSRGRAKPFQRLVLCRIYQRSQDMEEPEEIY